MSSKVTATQLVEVLVHEVQHSKLHALVDVVDRTTRDTGSVYAPWRGDPRGLIGLLHRIYAFTAVVEFWHLQRDLVPPSEVRSCLALLRAAPQPGACCRRLVARRHEAHRSRTSVRGSRLGAVVRVARRQRSRTIWPRPSPTCWPSTAGVADAGQQDLLPATWAVAGGQAMFGMGVAQRLLALVKAARPGGGVFPELTAREHEVLELMARGQSNAEIARRLVVSEETVRNNVSTILTKLHATHRAQAVGRARDAGMGSPNPT